MLNNYTLMEEVLTNPRAIQRCARHEDWRVRYAAAVAMGESRNKKHLPLIAEMFRYEGTRNLYSQPAVLGFENSYDDTRMAEQLVPIKEIFDNDYPEDLREDWRCRGRVRQALCFAVYDIGQATPEILDILHKALEDPKEDYCVKMASARALGKVGTAESIPYLHMALELDEWCTQTEAKKALALLEEKEPSAEG